MFRAIKTYIKPETEAEYDRAGKIDQSVKGGLVIALVTAAVLYMQTPEAQEAQDNVFHDVGVVACGAADILPPQDEMPSFAWMLGDAVSACK